MEEAEKKTEILKKLRTVTVLIKKNYEDDDSWLFPPDLLDILKIVDEIEKNSRFSIEDMARANFIYKKHKLIEKYMTEKGVTIKEMPEDEIHKLHIFHIYKLHGKIHAVKYARENMINEKGELLSLREALELVSKVIAT